MIRKPSLIIHTTYFEPTREADPSHADRVAAQRLGEELYTLLTRPSDDPLAWGPGICVRIATRDDCIDPNEAEHVVIVPILGFVAFADPSVRVRVVASIQRWTRPESGGRVFPLVTAAQWRDQETRIPKPLLTELYSPQNPRQRTLAGILLALARVLSRNDAYASRLFISHAKADLSSTRNAAEKLRDYITSETTGSAFFDRVALLPGEDLTAQLDREAARGVFVAVRGDRYSSRSWCRRELLQAKKQRIPTLTVELLKSGEARSAAYAGNGATVVWDLADEDAAARVSTLAMVEAVRHLYFLAESERVILAAELPSSTECLSRPPELLDIAALRQKPDSALVLLHPDPPMPPFEREVLQQADARLRPVTPSTAFARAAGSSIRAPLDGWQIALSLSESPDAPLSGGPSGLTAAHVRDATTFLARALIGAGATIAYGGDFRGNGFTSLLSQLVLSYKETARDQADYLHSYIAAHLDPVAGRDLTFTMHWLRGDARTRLPAPPWGQSVPSERASLHVSDMRSVMAEETEARVILGGAAIPRVFDPREGYGGRFPGVVEEAWRTLRVGKPLYVVGGFGGGAALVVDALENATPPPGLTDATWASNTEWTAFTEAYATQVEAVQQLGLPATQADMARDIYRLAQALLETDETSQAWNGLSVEENKQLFRTTDPLTIAALVLKGVIAASTQKAKGKLKIELVEGDVSAATELELLAFPTFRDVPLDGAGAAIDRVAGSAATLAHRSRRPVPVGTRALGASFVYAADLGVVSEAVNDPPGHAQAAAEALADNIRRHGFSRVGVVTFLGNVATDLSTVVSAMLQGLCLAADTAEIVWYERDPMRVEMLSTLLSSHPNVVLTRRTQIAAPAPVASTERRRTILTVRHEGGQLEVALLVHHANGLAPVMRSSFSEDERKQLAGSSREGAPSDVELRRRGSEIVRLLFGTHASRILEVVRGSELVVLHDASAAGIPYEAMLWAAEGEEAAPAMEAGILRHLLALNVQPDKSLPRPGKGGRLRVVVVINPTEDLDGADAEGDQLIPLLQAAGHDVITLKHKEATIQTVLEAIASPRTDILHYCGHAFYEKPELDGSGLICSDGELTLEKLLDAESVPRLAFVNACQAGRLRAAKPKAMVEAKAFAEFFLRAGVDAYLGTFWLVSDSGAATFAATVYEGLGQGLDLGEAVVRGRRRLKAEKNNDWANYLLYGHAGFRFVQSMPSQEALLSEQAALEPTARIDRTTIIASWRFPTETAPADFTVAALDPSSGEPLDLAKPIQLSRRDGTQGLLPIVTWVASIELRSPLEDAAHLRPSQGQAIDVGAGGERMGIARPKERALQLRAANLDTAATDTTQQAQLLKKLLDQQPDGGEMILHALLGAADARVLRSAVEAEAVGEQTRGVLAPKKVAPKVDAQKLAHFIDAYKVAHISPADAASEKFQTWEDWRAYVFAKGAIPFTLGGAVREPLWPKLNHPSVDMTHEVRQGEVDGGIEVALFADYGNGLYASRSVAKQIVDSNLPYAFHLGDVYYHGARQEFDDYFSKPLEGMLDRTELFMLTGNHEMYSKGEWFQNKILSKKTAYPQRQRQCAEMFRLRGAIKDDPTSGQSKESVFQIIGIDTMFARAKGGRLRLHDRADDAVCRVLDGWLDEHPSALTILMSTNEPWHLGTRKLTPLYDSLRATIAGRVDMWFWGNVHYAALYEPWKFSDVGTNRRHLVGSCIGHGGYPFYTQNEVGNLPDGVHCRWLEKKSRFWPEDGIRPDVGANGWCRMSLTRKATRWDVGLTYIDWVGRPRLRANLTRDDGASLRFNGVQESDAASVGATLTWTTLPETRG